MKIGCLIMTKIENDKKKEEQKKARDSIPSEVHEQVEAVAKKILGVHKKKKK